MRPVYPGRIGIWKLVFFVEGKSENLEQDQNQQQTQSIYCSGPESNPGWLPWEKASVLNTEPSLLPKLYCNNTALADFLCVFLFVLDPTYGDLTDYVYDKLNVTHSYGLELRPGDNEPNGFLLPDCEIVPIGREIMAALKAITPILAEGKKLVPNSTKMKTKIRVEDT